MVMQDIVNLLTDSAHAAITTNNFMPTSLDLQTSTANVESSFGTLKYLNGNKYEG